jgi:hypothetical protein
MHSFTSDFCYILAALVEETATSIEEIPQDESQHGYTYYNKQDSAMISN